MWEWNLSVFLTRAWTPVKILRTYCSKSTFFFLERVESTDLRMMVAFQPDAFQRNVDWLERFQCHRVAVFLFTVSYGLPESPFWKEYLDLRSFLQFLKYWAIQDLCLLNVIWYAHINIQYMQLSVSTSLKIQFSQSLCVIPSFRLQRKKTDLPLARPNGWVPIRPRFGWLLKPMLETSVGSFGWSTGLGSFGVQKFQGFEGSYILDVNMNQMNIIHTYGNMIMYVYYEYNYWLYMSMICIYIYKYMMYICNCIYCEGL